MKQEEKNEATDRAEYLDNLIKDLAKIRIILENSKTISLKDKEYFDVAEAAEYLSMSKSKIQKLCFERKIEHLKPDNGKVYFERKTLDAYIKKNRITAREKLSVDKLKI